MAKRQLAVGLKLELNFDKLNAKVRQGLIAGLTGAMDIYRKGVLEQVGLIDEHTLDELANMGHPYGVTKPRDFPHKDEIVHKQSGALVMGFRVMKVREDKTMSIGLSHTVPYIKYLIYGTSKMRPRRFHAAAFWKKANQMRIVLVNNIQAAIRGR